jgi:hypothetical protein
MHTIYSSFLELVNLECDRVLDFWIQKAARLNGICGSTYQRPTRRRAFHFDIAGFLLSGVNLGTVAARKAPQPVPPNAEKRPNPSFSTAFRGRFP